MNELDQAFGVLCARLGRDAATSEESDTCTLRAAAKAMVAFANMRVLSDMTPKDRAISMIRDLVVELETWEPELLEVLQAPPQAALMREWLDKPRVATCFLCAGKCRGHGLADAEAWKPEAGSLADRANAEPDLLEALDALWRQAAQSPDLLATKWGQDALDRARAAIAKATGQ